MTTVIPMPRIDTNGGEILITAWLKRPGDAIVAGEVIAEVSTDKVNIEIESPIAGVLEAILVKEGDTIVEGAALARVAVDG